MRVIISFHDSTALYKPHYVGSQKPILSYLGDNHKRETMLGFAVTVWCVIMALASYRPARTETIEISGAAFINMF